MLAKPSIPTVRHGGASNHRDEQPARPGMRPDAIADHGRPHARRRLLGWVMRLFVRPLDRWLDARASTARGRR